MYNQLHDVRNGICIIYIALKVVTSSQLKTTDKNIEKADNNLWNRK